MTLSPPHCGSVAPLVRSCRPPPQAPHFPLPTFTNFSLFLCAFLYLQICPIPFTYIHQLFSLFLCIFVPTNLSTSQVRILPSSHIHQLFSFFVCFFIPRNLFTSLYLCRFTHCFPFFCIFITGNLSLSL